MEVDKYRGGGRPLVVCRHVPPLVPGAGNPVVGRRHVRIVGAFPARHVAADAIIAASLRDSSLGRESTPEFAMTAQAAPAVEGGFFVGLGQDVRVVAGDTAQAALAGAIAPARAICSGWLANLFSAPAPAGTNADQN